ncbi:GNAT family N-acetyltransferase [Pseudonocardia zijingensis]|uniref:GNAT family N-acetyltransferase n=1 Tax=Pseudonocardia zijingensis TaxID=153376 RepID=A0ABP4BCG1_9PSEU
MTSAPRLVTEVGPHTAISLGTLWTAVTRAGGAVGFAADAPEQDIREAAEQAIEDVRAGGAQLFVLEDGDELVGAVFLRRGAKATTRHRADVVRLMVHPDLQGRGWGKALLDAVVAHATAIGLEQLLLSARGGTGLPDFYTKQGWTQVGLFPDALRIGDELRDEHWFQLRLS